MKRFIAAAVCAVLLLALSGDESLPRAAAQEQSERGLRAVGATREEIQAGRRPQYWAVVIGVSRYEYGDQNLDGNLISNLKYAADDAQAVYNFLRSDEGGGFRDQREGGHLILLKDADATKEKVESSLASLKQARPEDFFIIYIAAHGILVPQSVANSGMTEEVPYFALYDTYPDLGTIEKTAIRMEAFSKLVKEIPAKKGLVLSDTCHSAGVQMAGRGLSLTTRAQPRLLDEMSKIPRGIGYIAASGQIEKSYETDELKHGVFTYTLLEALRGNGDRDGDGCVNFSELVKYLLVEVPRRTDGKQHPHYNTDTVEANYIPLSLVTYAGPKADVSAGEYGTLVIRNPDVEGVELSIDSAPALALRMSNEHSFKVKAGLRRLSFIKGERREERQATVEAGKSLVFELNLTFSESHEEDLFEGGDQQTDVFLRDDKEPTAEAKEIFRKGVESFNKQKFDEAAVLFTRAAQANGGSYADALVYRGRAEQSLGRLKAAVATFAAALRLRPSDYETQTLLAEAKFNAGENVDEAVQLLEEVIRRHRNYDFARVVLGDIYFWRGELIKAERQLRRAILLRPKSPPAHLILSEVLIVRGGQEAAEARAKQRDMGQGGKLKQAVEEAETALRYFEELARKQVSAARGLKRLSISHVIFGGARYANDAVMAEARHVLAKALNCAVEGDESLPDGPNYLARARASIDEALKLSRNFTDRRRYVLALDTSAQNYFLQGNIERAIKEGEEALKVSESVPDLKGLPDAHYTLYSAYNSNQKFAKAAYHLQKYVDSYGPRLNPETRRMLEEEIKQVKRAAAANRQSPQ